MYLNTEHMHQTLDAEQAVLGSMLIDSTCIPDLLQRLQSDDFSLQIHQLIFQTICDMTAGSRPVDGITVYDALKQSKTGFPDIPDLRNYLAQLIEITPTSANAGEYASILLEQSRLRKLAELSAQITQKIQNQTDDSSELLQFINTQIPSVQTEKLPSGLRSLQELLPDYLDKLSVISELHDAGKPFSGLSTGFPALDQKILGLNPSDLILLAARPGMGKTALALNIALNAAQFMKNQDTENPKSIALFSLEMSREQLLSRILSSEAWVPNSRLKTGNLSENDWANIARTSFLLNKLPVLINEYPLISVSDIRSECNKIGSIGLVIIDYLQLMSAPKASGQRIENRQQAIVEITRNLKILAKELDVPILCLSQLSRANEKRDDKRPRLSDLRDSGAIEQDAGIVLFLHRDSYYDYDFDRTSDANPHLADLIIAKNRHGETGTIRLFWNPDYTRFSDFS